MSGHSKWATIKHKKGAADKKRGKLFAKLIRQVEVAAREGGGDPDMNPTLRTMFQKARDASVPLDTIERAIKRGTGELEGVSYEPITYEGYAPGRRRHARRGAHRQPQPHRLRRAQPVHQARRLDGRARRGGVAVRAQGHGARRPDAPTRTSSCSWPSTPAPRTSSTTARPGGWSRPPTDLHAVRTALEEAGMTDRLGRPHDGRRRTSSRSRTPGTAKQVLGLIDALEDLDDVQAVHANFDIPDDLLEAGPTCPGSAFGIRLHVRARSAGAPQPRAKSNSQGGNLRRNRRRGRSGSGASGAGGVDGRRHRGPAQGGAGRAAVPARRKVLHGPDRPHAARRARRRSRGGDRGADRAPARHRRAAHRPGHARLVRGRREHRAGRRAARRAAFGDGGRPRPEGRRRGPDRRAGGRLAGASETSAEIAQPPASP